MLIKGMQVRTWKKFFAKDPEDTPTDGDEGIGDMLDHVLGDGAAEPNEDPAGEEPADEEPEGDPEDEPEPDPEDEDEPEPEDEDEDLDEEAEDEEDDDSADEASELKKQNQHLMQLLQKVMDGQMPTKKPEPEPEPEIDLQDEQSFKEMAEVFDLDESETKKFTSFIKMVIDRTEKSTTQSIMKSTPELISKTIDSKTQTQKLKENFYSEHPALGEVKDYVANIASVVAKTNPEMTLEQVLSESAKRAYKALGIKQGKAKKKSGDSEEPGKGKKKKPAFAKTKGSRKAKKKKGKLEAELDAMLALDE